MLPNFSEQEYYFIPLTKNIMCNYRNEHYVGTYFWFMGDLFIVCFFATSFVSAYRYIHLRYKLELDKKHNKEQIRKVIQDRIYKNVACKYNVIPYVPMYYRIPFKFIPLKSSSLY